MTSDAHSHVDGFSRILVLKTISRTKSVKTGKGEKTGKRANGKETNGKEDPGSAMVTGQRYPYPVVFSMFSNKLRLGNGTKWGKTNICPSSVLTLHHPCLLEVQDPPRPSIIFKSLSYSSPSLVIPTRFHWGSVRPSETLGDTPSISAMRKPDFPFFLFFILRKTVKKPVRSRKKPGKKSRN